MTAIDKIVDHAAKIKAGKFEEVRPGMEASFTEACVPGDCGWQGDLKLTVVESVPDGYVEVESPGVADRQLVPGSTDGARHCLDSLAGVKLFRPKVWTEDSLDGPCFVLAKPRKVLHPTHGAVTIPAGFTVLCRYQREFNKEAQRERRARD